MSSRTLATTVLLFAALAQGPAATEDPPTPEPAWVHYRHKKVDFGLDHPADWSVERPEGSIAGHLSDPRRPVHLFVTAFLMNGGSLERFAEMKFGAQPEIFGAAGSARRLQGPGWEGLLQEAEDVRPGRTEDTRRVLLCARHDDVYVSLALYLERREFTARRDYYERLFTSLRFGGGAPPPSQP